MSTLRCLLVLLLGWLAPLHSTSAQALSAWLAQEDLPPPPANRILDNADLFSRDQEALQRIIQHIRKLETEHGFILHLVTEHLLISSTPPELASALQLAWLPEGNGIVIVFESDTRRLGLGRADESTPDIDNLGTQLQSYETVTLLTKTLTALVESLSEKLAQAHQRRQTPPPAGRSLRMALVAIGGLCMLALGTLGIGLLLRRSSPQSNPPVRFPNIDATERLGAPFGGGSVSSRRFRPPSAPRF
jgi:DNA-binding transcriptional MerR regulator